MACGVLVVASTASSIPEIRRRRLLVNPTDEAALVQRCRWR
jgi:hypothetical protein